MPRKIFHLKQFHGGLNESAEITDIEDHEAISATECDFSSIGKIKVLGGSVVAVSGALNEVGTLRVLNSTPGQGLFAFASDRDRDGTLASCSFYIANNDNEIWVYDTNDTTWTRIVTTAQWSDSSDVQPVFLFNNSRLTISDGQLTDSNPRRTWGYVSRTHFTNDGTDLTPGSDGADAYAGMYGNLADIAAPTRGLSGFAIAGTAESDSDADTIESATSSFGLNLADGNAFTTEVAAAATASQHYQALYADGSNPHQVNVTSSDADSLETVSISGQNWNGSGSGHSFSLWPHPGTGLNLEIEPSASGGTIVAGDYQFASSFVYDGLQESKILVMPGNINLSGTGKFANIVMHFNSPYNERISGMRTYFRLTTDPDSEWTLLYDVVFDKGYRSSLEHEFKGSFAIADNPTSNSTLVQISCDDYTDKGSFTYQNINGFEPTENIDVSYKSAVVVQGITYAGNVRQNGINYPDRILKCAMVNQGVASDVFPESNFIDLMPDDGDEIVKLETFADRVLVFKKNRLFVVNYSTDTGRDYIEAEYPYLGIERLSHSFQTSRGIVFMNAGGVHLYNGEGVITLTDKMNNQMVQASGTRSSQTRASTLGQAPTGETGSGFIAEDPFVGPARTPDKRLGGEEEEFEEGDLF